MLKQRKDKAIGLVLGGGGMKGLGLVGAVAALEDAGYDFRVIGGCSAGSLVAALKASGMPMGQLRETINNLDFTSFFDNRRTSGLLGAALQGFSVVRRAAINSGNSLLVWIEQTLAEQGIHTFADLKYEDPKLPIELRYKLVVIAADITGGRLLRLPWDYHLLGLDPDKQSVAGAVRAATALPLIYEPYHIGESVLMDGGMVTNYPVGLFREFKRQKLSTIGIQLSFAPEVKELSPESIRRFGSLVRAMVYTTLNAQAEEMMRDLEVAKRTIVVDVDDVKITDFHIDKDKQKRLYQNGYKAAERFIKTS